MNALEWNNQFSGKELRSLQVVLQIHRFYKNVILVMFLQKLENKQV